MSLSFRLVFYRLLKQELKNLYGLPLWTLDDQTYVLEPHIALLDKLKERDSFLGGGSIHSLFEKHPYFQGTTFAMCESGELDIQDKEVSKSCHLTSYDTKFIDAVIHEVESSKSRSNDNPGWFFCWIVCFFSISVILISLFDLRHWFDNL